jgi:uncharacterized membrane protein
VFAPRRLSRGPWRLLRRLHGETAGTATLLTASTLLVGASITILMVSLVSYLTFQSRLQAAADAAALAAAMEVRAAFLTNVAGESTLTPEQVQQRGKLAAENMVRAQNFPVAPAVRVSYPAIYEVYVEVEGQFSTGPVTAKATSQIVVPPET